LGGNRWYTIHTRFHELSQMVQTLKGRTHNQYDDLTDLISHPSEKWNNKEKEEFWIKHASTVFKWTLESTSHICFEQQKENLSMELVRVNNTEK